jgi:hypothetical protein
MLDIDTVARFVLDRGLIDVQAIIDGELTIQSAARRNRNLRVEGPAGLGFLVNQPEDVAEGGQITLRNEGAFYDLCTREPFGEPMSGIMPRMVFRDVERSMLALELCRDSETLWDHYMASGPSVFPVATARALGRALGTFHATFGRIGIDDPELAWLPRGLPWVLAAHKPGPELLSIISPANFQTIRILQSDDGFGRHLDSWRKRWRAETVIHGDIKSENVLVLAPANSAAEIRLIDWELVQLGDPAWDFAGALQEFLLFWTNSMPTTPELTAEERIARAGYPLSTLQPALRALWRGYKDTATPTSDGLADLLLRAVAFSAARLIQSAYEYSQSVDRIPVQAVLLLQIGANLLAEPGLGQVQLFGIAQ